jgi:endonuclease YncB( thermonuclease family)
MPPRSRAARAGREFSIGQRKIRAREGLQFALLSLGLVAPSPGDRLHAEDRTCPDDGGMSAQVMSVNEHLELALDDGTKLKIAGVDPPRPTPTGPDFDARARDQLAQWLVGQEIGFRQLEPGRDRWGRIVAFVYAPAPKTAGTPSGKRLAVGEALIDVGLARYEPSAASHPCRTALITAEASARAARVGLWADPYYAVIAAADFESFAERAGSSVIAEGRVSGVGGHRPRITLYLGPRKGLDLSVTILPRNNKEFEAAYSNLARLTGETIRVRGLLDMRFGPQIEISDTDAVEVIGQEPGAAASPPPR